MPTLGDRQGHRGRRLQWQCSRAASALALALVASSAGAPGVGPTLAQATPADAPTATLSSRLISIAAIAPEKQGGEPARSADAATAESKLGATHTRSEPSVDLEPTVTPEPDAGAASAGDMIERAATASATAPRTAAAVNRDGALAFLAQLDVSALDGTSDAATESIPAEPVWQDQYLFADDELPPLDATDVFAAQPFGREALSIELTSYTSDDDFFGEDIERGARIFFSRETENWGTFDLDLQLASVDSTFVGRELEGSEAVVTLRQSLVPVSATATMNTVAGHQRKSASSLLHSGYRYRLPSSIFLGLETELSGIDSRSRLTLGNLGAYRGVRMPRFDETGGRIASFAYERTVNDRFEVGAELTNIRGDDDIRDHTSALLGGRYQRPDDSQEHAFRLLADDDGQLGLWADSRLSSTRLPTLRFGFSYLEPDLVWADWPIPNDQLSTYLRADKGNSSYDFSVGYDYLETGVRSDVLASMKTHSAFFSGQLRIRRAFSLGATASLSSRRIDAELDEDQDIERLNVFASLRSPIGTTRLELLSHSLDSPVASNRRERQGAAASLSWRTPERVRLTTELRTERVDSQRGKTERTELSALFRYELLDNVSLGLTSSIYETRGVEFAEDNGLMLSADARWSINRNWQASLSINRNRADFDVSSIDFFGTSSNAGTTSLWLTVNYQRRRGQPYPTFGRTHDGMSGSGSVGGEIFFDDNRDSIRQPSERAAAGVIVVLDGQYETRTDAQGRYTFSPVPTGAHELVVVSEQLPLPWGLDNEAPRRVVVRFRDVATVDFPLVELN